jgi:hypothetical protein
VGRAAIGAKSKNAKELVGIARDKGLPLPLVMTAQEKAQDYLVVLQINFSKLWVSCHSLMVLVKKHYKVQNKERVENI